MRHLIAVIALAWWTTPVSTRLHRLWTRQLRSQPLKGFSWHIYRLPVEWLQSNPQLKQSITKSRTDSIDRVSRRIRSPYTYVTNPIILLGILVCQDCKSGRRLFSLAKVTECVSAALNFSLPESICYPDIPTTTTLHTNFIKFWGNPAGSHLWTVF